MTHHDDHASTDTEIEHAKPRPSELTDKMDDIMNTPLEGPSGPPQRPLSTSPNNEAEAQPGAIVRQEGQGNDPGGTDAGGGA